MVIFILSTVDGVMHPSPVEMMTGAPDYDGINILHEKVTQRSSIVKFELMTSLRWGSL